MQNTQIKQIKKLQLPMNQLMSAKSAIDLSSDPNRSCINAISSKNFEKYQVIIENEQLQNELKCIEWRSKTQFPIVKILFYKILQKKLLNECSVVQVAIENFPSNLNTLPKMTLNHILYLFKESLIGFQRLFDHFGTFDISNKMILINKNSKCRVWMNENITLNFPSRRSKITQSQFILKITKIFQQKCIKSINSGDFFNKISTKSRIIQALQFLQMFVKTNKIVLANRLNLITEALSPKKNIEKCWDDIDKTDELFNCNSLKKIPKFIMQLRQQKKIEETLDTKSFDSPKKKNCKVNKDRSLVRTAFNKKQKSQIQSGNKSNLSPLSQISQDAKKQTKSNNETILKPAVRELLKQNSQQVINTYATMIPISKPYGLTQKKIAQDDKRLKILEMSKSNIPEDNKKVRKMSNQQSPAKVNRLKFLNKEKIQDSDQCKLGISQQTATTSHSSILNRKITQFIEKAPEINIIEPNIYEKNGWLKRVNNLVTDNNFRDTLHSHYDGPQTFSEDYLLSGETLGILGSMGKNLKGSIIGA